MEFLIFLALAGWGGFKLFKLSTAMGGETLRAYVFLEALLNDAPLHIAQTMAARDMADLPTELILHIKREIGSVHGGKQTPLIAEAYKWGMMSKVPSWYRSLIELKGTSLSVKLTYTMPLMAKDRVHDDNSEPPVEWARSFIVYFVLHALKTGPQGILPGSVRMPEELLYIMEGNVPDKQKLALSASLRLYMDFTHPGTNDYRAEILPNEIKKYISYNFRFLNLPGIGREIIKKWHTQFTGNTMSDKELNQFTTEMKRREAEGVDVVELMYGMGLMTLAEKDFQSMHGKTYEQFEPEIVAFSHRHKRYENADLNLGVAKTNHPNGKTNQEDALPAWVRSFMLYSLLVEFHSSSAKGDEGGMNANLIGLLHGAVTPELQRILPISHRAYMVFQYPDTESYDIGVVVQYAHIYLKDVVRRFSVDSELRAWLQRVFIKENGYAMSDEMLDQKLNATKLLLQHDKEREIGWRNLFIESRTEELFEIAHGMPFIEFVQKMDNFGGKGCEKT